MSNITFQETLKNNKFHFTNTKIFEYQFIRSLMRRAGMPSDKMYDVRLSLNFLVRFLIRRSSTLFINSAWEEAL